MSIYGSGTLRQVSSGFLFGDDTSTAASGYLSVSHGPAVQYSYGGQAGWSYIGYGVVVYDSSGTAMAGEHYVLADNAYEAQTAGGSGNGSGNGSGSGSGSGITVQEIIDAICGNQTPTGGYLGVLGVIANAVAQSTIYYTSSSGRALAQLLDNAGTLTSVNIEQWNGTAVTGTGPLDISIETGENAISTLRIIRAVLAGKATDTGTVATFTRADGATAAITVTHDASGNRTVVTKGTV